MAARLKPVLSSPSRFSRFKDGFIESCKTGRLNKIGLYFQNIFNDYKTVAVETTADIREKPVKAAIYFTAIGVTGYLGYTNPPEDSFWAQTIANTNDLLLVGDPIRNPNSDSFMQRIIAYKNAGRMRYTTFGVCSIMWVDNFDPNVDLYEAHCKSLKVGWLDWKDHVVDVGVLGHWRRLEAAMIDYDINPEEWRETEMSDTNSS